MAENSQARADRKYVVYGQMEGRKVRDTFVQ